MHGGEGGGGGEVVSYNYGQLTGFTGGEEGSIINCTLGVLEHVGEYNSPHE